MDPRRSHPAVQTDGTDSKQGGLGKLAGQGRALGIDLDLDRDGRLVGIDLFQDDHPPSNCRRDTNAEALSKPGGGNDRLNRASDHDQPITMTSARADIKPHWLLTVNPMTVRGWEGLLRQITERIASTSVGARPARTISCPINTTNAPGARPRLRAFSFSQGDAHVLVSADSPGKG
jgi:hypothetical protein